MQEVLYGAARFAIECFSDLALYILGDLVNPLLLVNRCLNYAFSYDAPSLYEL